MEGLSSGYDLEDVIDNIYKCGLRYVTVVENIVNRISSILPNKL